MQLGPLAGGCSAVVKTPEEVIAEIDGQGREELDPTEALFEPPAHAAAPVAARAGLALPSDLVW